MKKAMKTGRLTLGADTIRVLTDHRLGAVRGGLRDSGNGTCSQEGECTTANTCYLSCTSEYTCGVVR